MKRTQLTRLIALFSAILLLCGSFVGCRAGGRTHGLRNRYALAAAVYPKMNPYPKSGEWEKGFSEEYRLWQLSRSERYAYRGAADGRAAFFEKTVPAFLSSAKGENRLYSPLNLYMALAIMAETAGGNTRAQILELLGAESIEGLRQEANKVWNANYCDDGAVTALLAASLWLSDSAAWNRSTLQTLAGNYYASSYCGEMSSAGFQTAFRDWLNTQTGGMLREQAEGVSFSPETILALAATLQYRAKWETEFQTSATASGVFHAPQGDVQAEYMKRTDLFGTCLWGDRFSATALELQETAGKLWLVLPDEGVTPEQLLTDAQTVAFLADPNAWENRKTLQTHLSIPKFDVVSEVDLSDGLKALGVTDAFGPAADFTPLTSDPAYLSEVNHSVRFAIDEEGVSAATFTVIQYCGMAQAPEKEWYFVLDRPFLFVLTDEDGLPLFAGVVNRP